MLLGVLSGVGIANIPAQPVFAATGLCYLPASATTEGIDDVRSCTDVTGVNDENGQPLSADKCYVISTSAQGARATSVKCDDARFSKCPDGRTGSPPNCVAGQTCPTGQTGTPPNCIAAGSADKKCTDNVVILKAACGDNKSVQTNSIFLILLIVIRFLTVGVGIAVAGGIIYGGLLYMTARGNSAQTHKAVITIVNSMVGLLLYIFMFTILNFLIPGGIFS